MSHGFSKEEIDRAMEALKRCFPNLDYLFESEDVMKKYDADGKCIKCGGEEIKDKHLEARNQAYADVLNRRVFMGNPYQPYPERISRTCKNCGYIWDEAPLDDIEESNFDAMKAEMDKDPGGIKATCETAKAMTDLLSGKVEIMEHRELEIRLGDTVKTEKECPVKQCEVTGLCMHRATLKRTTGVNCVCGISLIHDNLTLISRGPEVHTFEGVNISEISSNSFEVYSPGHNLGFPSLSQKFTIKLTKEDIPS